MAHRKRFAALALCVGISVTVTGCSLSSRLDPVPDPPPSLSAVQASSALTSSMTETIRVLLGAPDTQDVSRYLEPASGPMSCGTSTTGAAALAENQEVKATISPSAWDQNVYRGHNEVGLMLARNGYFELGAEVADGQFDYQWTSDEAGQGFTISLRIQSNRGVRITGTTPCLAQRPA